MRSSWRQKHSSATASAFVPLTFAPGEAYQFDWSHEIVVLNGVTTTVKVAHLRLCHSRMMFVRAYPRETQEMVFDAHERAFAFFKGACMRGVYDYVPNHIIVDFVAAAVMWRAAAECSSGGDAWPHIAQRAASHSSSFGSLCQTGLRGGPAEEVEGGWQASSASCFILMLISA